MKLQFSQQRDCSELPVPFTPTLVAIRVYPDANVTVGDVVAALDRVRELAPANTIVVTELR